MGIDNGTARPRLRHSTARVRHNPGALRDRAYAYLAPSSASAAPRRNLEDVPQPPVCLIAKASASNRLSEP